MKKFILLILLNSFLFAQDSLYLVNTLTGDSINRIFYAKGAGDINGDGYADLVVSYSDSVKIFLGNERFELQPAYSYGNNNGFVLCPGDVNNDGCADLLIGQKKYPIGYHNHISTINLLFGGSAGLDSCNTFSYNVSLLDQIFSTQVDPLGDVNGDGYNDFAISAPYNWTNGISYIYVYLGGDTIRNEPFVTFKHSPFIDPNSEATFGRAVTGIGDVNNDGYDDILIGDPGYADTVGAVSSGMVYLYNGSADMDSIADSTLTYENEYIYGVIIKKIVDIDKNRHANMAIVSGEYIHFFDYPDELFSINGSKFGFGGFVSIGTGGDINKDGYNDFIIGNTNYKNNNALMVGASFVYLGSANMDTIYDYKLEGEHKWDEFSRISDIIGDFNGDGYDDFFIIATSYPDYKNPQGKLYLYSYKNYDSIENINTNVIKNFELYQNYPNPFNPVTTINYKINKTKNVQLNIYNINGKLIKTLVNQKQSAGFHKAKWNGKNEYGYNVSSGVYFYRLKAGNIELNKKMLLLR